MRRNAEDGFRDPPGDLAAVRERSVRMGARADTGDDISGQITRPTNRALK
jgi:hypothetical protein